MTPAGLVIGVLILGSVALAWSALMGAQEQARRAAARRCRDLGLQFLDESLVRLRTRPGRGRNGRLGLVHWYRFEFSADGSRRHGGVVTVAGRVVRKIEMEPWPEPGSSEEGG